MGELLLRSGATAAPAARCRLIRRLLARPPRGPQERGRVSRRLLLETQELAVLEASGLVGGAFKTREVRAHTKTTYQQSK